MRKDLKTGIILGAVLVSAALLLVSIFSYNVGERRRWKNPAESDDKASDQFTNLQSTTSMSAAHTQTKTEPEQKPAPLRNNTSTNEAGADRQEPKRQIHIVAEGETLTSISIEYYGSADMWQKILNANKGIIKDANKLHPGMRLVIPNQ